ncbi:MAG: M3 family metallopeptidase [Phycisphaerales bacterium JB043]
MRLILPALSLTLALGACSSLTEPLTQAPVVTPDEDAPARSWRAYRSLATQHGVRLDLPVFESTPEELDDTVTAVLNTADTELTDLASQDPREATFESTLGRLDTIYYPVINVANKMSLMAQTQVTEEMRRAANDQSVRISGWFVEAQYRQDVYDLLEACQYRLLYGTDPAEGEGEMALDTMRDRAKRMPQLIKMTGPQQKLFFDTFRDYRQAGMHLDDETKSRVEAMQKELAALSAEFGANNSSANESIMFTREQLDGFTDEMLTRYANDEGTYTFRQTVTPEFVAVMTNASDEETRRAMKSARYSVNKDTNIDILNQMVRLRQQIAGALGYATWADYQTESRMAGTGETAFTFVTEMAQGLEPKFRNELEELRALKVEETGDENAQIRLWDFRYYQDKLLKKRFAIDTEQLRNYFPFDASVEGMFDIFEELFDLKIVELKAENTWEESVELYMCFDGSTNMPLGMVYFDMYPRTGKYSHFAQFSIIDSKKLDSGETQRPVVALVCNFTPPTEDKPSLISHDELQTLFHEFGHALHSILTQAEFAQQEGTNVPRDFVEAPSQMLEAWTWDPDVLNRFAGHYLDPTQKVDPALLARMKEARLATIGVHYRRQLALGTGDLRIHTSTDTVDVDEVVNGAFEDVFLATPDGTAMAAYWGHLAGYSAGYYGYAWADSIAQDMQSVFQEAPGGLMDKEIGMRLRNEIYAAGGSREIDDSIRAFLGRDRSLVPFLKSIGIDPDNQ